eukprot:3936800-Rhodomonas_salina.1
MMEALAFLISLSFSCQQASETENAVYGLHITSPSSDKVVSHAGAFIHLSFNLTTLLPLECQILMFGDGEPLGRWLPDKQRGEPGVPILWNFLGTVNKFSRPVPRSLEVMVNRAGKHVVKASVLCGNDEAVVATTEKEFEVAFVNKLPRLEITYPENYISIHVAPAGFSVEACIQVHSAHCHRACCTMPMLT